MGLITDLLSSTGLLFPADPVEAAKLAAQLSEDLKLSILPHSISASNGLIFAVGRRDDERLLCVAARPTNSTLIEFVGKELSASIDGERISARACVTNHANAIDLRKRLPFTRPQVIGLKKSFGFGDRLGLATPGHVRAVRPTTIRPFFAQQSVREMTRSGRDPEAVLDDATWGVLEQAYREPHGADADHLKNTEDADACIAAGFTFYTVDPGYYVDASADTGEMSTIIQKFSEIPWKDLETTPADLRKRLLTAPIRVSPKLTVDFTEETLSRAAVKYARALLHVHKFYRHLAAKLADDAFELEISVDETESPTSLAEHCYIASELRRLGVRWVSLALRFVGAFEKGVDYIGDLAEFERKFVGHVEIARELGPYKLGLHSGSDKFSIYPIIARHAGDLLHVKTAGTSYLEALRVVARLDPALFREILAFAVSRYEEDRKSYHVSARISRVPPAESTKDAQLEKLFEQFDARQVLHVTYGSVLTAKDESGAPRFRERLLALLKRNPEIYAAAVEKHMERHVRPFA